MASLFNFSLDGYSKSAKEKFEIIEQVTSGLNSDIQYSKALRCKNDEFMDAIQAYSNCAARFPENPLPTVGVLDVLIKMEDYNYSILFFKKYLEKFNKKYDFLYIDSVERLIKLDNNKAINPFLKFFGTYSGTLKTNKGSKEAILRISIVNSDFSNMILVLDEKDYIKAFFTPEGIINIVKDYMEDEDYEFGDTESFEGSGKINSQMEIELRIEKSSVFEDVPHKMEFLGSKTLDYFHTLQDYYSLP